MALVRSLARAGRPAALVVFAALAALTTGVRADQPVIYAPEGLALGGYDAVSYFRDGGPVPGRPEFALMWHGATWYFASPETLMEFEMDPRAYAPQFGGYCAYALAEGHLGVAEPRAFAIVDGRLYLMNNKALAHSGEATIRALVAEADAHWPDVLQSGE